MNKRIALSGIALSFAAFGCSTASVRMMPGEKINRALARDHDRGGAEQAAVEAAHKYCKEKGSDAVFASNDTKDTYVVTSGKDYEVVVDFKCRSRG